MVARGTQEGWGFSGMGVQRSGNPNPEKREEKRVRDRRVGWGPNSEEPRNFALFFSLSPAHHFRSFVSHTRCTRVWSSRAVVEEASRE